MRVKITEGTIFIDLDGVEVLKIFLEPTYITMESHVIATDEQARQLIDKLSNARTLCRLLDSAIKTVSDIGRIVVKVKTDPNDRGVSFFDDSLSESGRLVFVLPFGNEQVAA